MKNEVVVQRSCIWQAMVTCGGTLIAFFGLWWTTCWTNIPVVSHLGSNFCIKCPLPQKSQATTVPHLLTKMHRNIFSVINLKIIQQTVELLDEEKNMLYNRPTMRRPVACGTGLRSYVWCKLSKAVAHIVELPQIYIRSYLQSFVRWNHKWPLDSPLTEPVLWSLGVFFVVNSTSFWTNSRVAGK